MFKHFIGHVYRFDDEPDQELPFVDFPLLTQDEKTSESLLIQIDPEDLNQNAEQRIKNTLGNSPLPIDLLKENHGIEPELQIAAYNEIISDISNYHDLLGWTGFPEYKQLKKCCEIIWAHWVKRARNGVYSASQLTFRIWSLHDDHNLVFNTMDYNLGKLRYVRPYIKLLFRDLSSEAQIQKK